MRESQRKINNHLQTTCRNTTPLHTYIPHLENANHTDTDIDTDARARAHTHTLTRSLTHTHPLTHSHTHRTSCAEHLAHTLNPVPLYGRVGHCVLVGADDRIYKSAYTRGLDVQKHIRAYSIILDIKE